MKRIGWSILVTAALGMLLSACKSDSTTNPTTGHASILGRVRDITSANALGRVAVTALDMATNASLSTSTDTVQGTYAFSFSVDSTSTVLLTYSLSGYRDTSIIATISSGKSTTADMYLTPKSVLGVIGTGTNGTGLAHSIAFVRATPSQLTVTGVGGAESAIVEFEVRDSLGVPIDAAHAISLTFAIVNGPGGGEYVYPPVVTTNKNGHAGSTVNAGTKSGPIQVAVSGSVVVGGVTRYISSAPVKLIIAAGFADQTHFTLASKAYNLPILFTEGKRNPISVLVGDKYSNPVATGTAVYFSTTAGVIQPSVFTSPDGEGTVDLISGNPMPLGAYADPTPGFGDGYHWVKARTMDSTSVVKDSIRILWTYRSLVTNLNPGTFNIANGGFQDFTFTVSDYLGHPLASGTTINVQAQVAPPPDPNTPINQVLLSFGQSGTITLDDVIVAGGGTTNFSFRLSDGTTAISDPAGSSVSLQITVDGPNGKAYLTTNGLVH
jgi:hypothetical protein